MVSSARWPSSHCPSRWPIAPRVGPCRLSATSSSRRGTSGDGPGRSWPTGPSAPRAGRHSDAALIVEPQGLVGGCEQRFRPAAQLGAERPFRGRAQHAPLHVDAGRLDGVAQALDPPDRLAFDQDRAVVIDRRQLAVAVQTFEQRLGAPVDEALGQPLVQGIAQRVLDRARPLLPVERVVEPVRAVGDVGPGADVGEPR